MSVQDLQSADLATFEAIRAYDWATDREFQAGLQSILSSVSTPDQAAALTTRAKCFFYSKKSGVHIDGEIFDTWLARQEATPSAPTEAEPEAAPAPAAITRSPQPKDSASTLGHPSIDTANPLVSSKDFLTNVPSRSLEQAEVDPTSSTPISGKAETSYPTSFAHIVELITTGQPIPGIREIPNVLNTAPPSEATRPKRQKPWEIAAENSDRDTEKLGHKNLGSKQVNDRVYDKSQTEQL